MNIRVDITHRFRDFTLDAAFEAGGGVTAIFGASGAGKTTLVNAVAGLLRPDRGRIEVGGRVFLDTEAGIDVPVTLRELGYVFQDERLFPHLTVRQNLAYASRFKRPPANPTEFEAIIAMLGIEGILGRRPAALSGGEKQRVAIGRALLAKPRLLLLDEPLASLDMDRRAEVLPYLARLRDEAGLPIIYVSHARAEVRALASTVVVMAGGRVTSQGPVGQVLGRGGAGPGVTLPVSGQGPVTAGMVRLSTAAGDFFSLAERVPVTGARSVTVIASDIVLSSAPRDLIAAPNVFEATAGEALKAGPGMMDVPLTTGSSRMIARLTIAEAGRIGLAPGQQVRAIIARFTVA